MTFLWASAAMILATAAVHSVMGERLLIGPLLDSKARVMQRPQGRAILRFAWHFTSVLMLLTAALVAWPGTPRALILVTGGVYLAVGLYDAAATRGRHVGWPFLAGSGLLALLGAA